MFVGEAGSVCLQDPAPPVSPGIQSGGLEPHQPGLDRKTEDHGGQQEGKGFKIIVKLKVRSDGFFSDRL